MPAAFRGFHRHACEIRLDIEDAAARLTDEVHVIGANVFVDRALSAEGEPANQAISVR